MKAISVILVVLALTIGILPQFSHCPSTPDLDPIMGGKVENPPCYWTALAEIAVAIPLLGLGIISYFFNNRDARFVTGVTGILLGLAAFLLPTWIIGVCDNNNMICNTIMEPVLIFSGVLVISANLASLLMIGHKPQANL